MKKYFVGCFVGMAIMYCGQAYGADLFVGQKVQGTVKVILGDKEIGDAPVINGTSLLPVRKVAESLNLYVEASKGQVTIKESPKLIATELATLFKMRETLGNKIEQKKRAIATIQEDIANLETKLAGELREENRKSWQEILDLDKQNLPLRQSELEEVQNQLSEVQQQIDILQSNQQEQLNGQ